MNFFMTGQIRYYSKFYITIETDTEVITYKYASFIERLLARIIDGLIIFLPNYIIPVIPAWLYLSLQYSNKKQSTLGQKALGICVLSVDGDKVNFGKASGKFFGNFLCFMTFLIGYFMMFFSNKRQGLHDSVSGCIVVSMVSRRLRIPISE